VGGRHKSIHTIIERKRSGSMNEEDDNGGYPLTAADLPVIKDPTSGDRLIKGDALNNSRHMAIAHMAAGGSSQKMIAKALDLSQAWVCTVMSQTEVKQAIKDIQKELWGDDISKRFRASLHRSMDVMEGVIDNKSAKDRDRMQAAQWVLEKVTGKATQTVEHKGNVLSGLLDQLDAMKQKDVMDITEQIEAVEEKSGADQILDTFVAGNIPSGVRVGGKDEQSEED